MNLCKLRLDKAIDDRSCKNKLQFQFELDECNKIMFCFVFFCLCEGYQRVKMHLLTAVFNGLDFRFPGFLFFTGSGIAQSEFRFTYNYRGVGPKCHNLKSNDPKFYIIKICLRLPLRPTKR